MNKWKLQDAKARLSELIKKAQKHKPQFITVRGEPAVVVLAIDDFNKLTRSGMSFVEFMRSSPLVGEELDIERDKSLHDREIDL